MKPKILTAIVLAFALTFAVLAAPDMQGVETAYETEASYAQNEQDACVNTNLVPILWEKAPATLSQTARLSSENIVSFEKIVVTKVETTGVFVSEKTVTADVYFDLVNHNLYDAKTKLSLSIVDADGKTVAKQKSCDIVYNYDVALRYELECVSGESFIEGNAYFYKLDYSGEYEYREMCTASSWYASTKPVLVKMETVNVSQQEVLFYIANADENETYTFEIDGTMYSSEKIETGVYRVYVTEFCDLTYINAVETEVYAYSSANPDECFSYNEFTFYGVGYGVAYDDYIEGIYFSDIHVNSSTAWFSFYGREVNYNGYSASYSASDKSGISVVIYDTVTCKIVAKSNISDVVYNEDWNEFDVEVKFSEKLVQDRKYVAVMDDGYTVRLMKTQAVGGPYFIGTTGNGTITESKTSYELGLADVYCMPDISKLNINIYAPDGSLYASLDKTSVIVNNASADKNYCGSIDYTLNVVGEFAASTDYVEYILEVTYDGEIVKSLIMDYFPGSTDEPNESDMHAYNIEAFNDGKDTYVMIRACDIPESFEPSEATYVMYSAYASSSQSGGPYIGTFHRMVDDGTRSKAFVVKFSGAKGISGCQIKIAFGDGNECIADFWYGSQYSEMPYIYEYYSTEKNGKKIFLAEGLSDNSSYSVMLFDAVTKEAVYFDAKKVPGEQALAVDYTGAEKHNYDGKAYLVVDGKRIIEVDHMFWSSFSFSGSDFYALYKNQSHRIAVVGLPSGDYRWYKLANSEEELETKTYLPITKDFVDYVLPEGDGKKTIYAKFKAADGSEKVMKTYVTIDMTGPDLSYVNTAKEFVIGKYGYFTIGMDYTVNEECDVWCEIYDERGAWIGYDYSRLYADQWYTSFSFDAGTNGSKFVNAKKLIIYAMDDFGNKSQVYTIDIAIKEKYGVYEDEDMYIVIDNETGHIVFGSKVISDTEVLVLPSEINGITVTGIENGAIAYASGLSELYIPASITYFESIDAFQNIFAKIYVTENNAEAQSFLSTTALNWEVKNDAGDMTGDYVIDDDDVTELANKIALGTAYFEYGDVYGNDGVVDIKDLIKLLQMSKE